MSNLVANDGHDIMERVLTVGDLSQLTPVERNAYYGAVCRSTGLNPLTRPFEYVKLSGKLVLYARRDAADQLRKINGVSLRITSQETIGDLYVVTVEAAAKDGRADSDMGAVAINGLRGEALANAMLKACTKAKRRVTLSICGLGFLDETEVSDIPREQRQDWQEPATNVPPQVPANDAAPVIAQEQAEVWVFDHDNTKWAYGATIREALTIYGDLKKHRENKVGVALANLDLLKSALDVAPAGSVLAGKLAAEIEAAEALTDAMDGMHAEPAEPVREAA